MELPTAELEHARRLAQRGVTVNGLVRAYRLGHKALLDAVLDEEHVRRTWSRRWGLPFSGRSRQVTFGYTDLDHAAGAEH